MNSKKSTKQVKQYCMVIDLHACVGCAACDIACKSENNVPDAFSWSNHAIETSGRFPNVRFTYTPTLCNHCSDAPCVTVCPTTAMVKDEDGVTKHDTDKCIGCAACSVACPYDVIYFNRQTPHQSEQSGKGLIAGCTSSPDEVATQSPGPSPYFNLTGQRTTAAIRPRGVVEKCTFCEQRIVEGLDPACVQACPAGARIFGDRRDPESNVSRLLVKYHSRALRPEKGTKPNVLYIRAY